MLQSLLPYLGTPSFHLLALILASTAALQSLLALWAATSPRHWFWRALAVWCAVMALVPIRAYQPAAVFAASSLLIVAVVRVFQPRLHQAQEANGNTSHPPASRFRFGLNDIFLLMVVVGLCLAGMLHVQRHLVRFDVANAALTAIAVAVVAVAAWSTVQTPRRAFRGVCLLLAVAAFALLIPRLVSDSDNFDACKLLGVAFAPSDYWSSAGKSIVPLAELALLLLALAPVVLSQPHHAPRRRAWLPHRARSLVLSTVMLLLGVIYWQMLRRTPTPRPFSISQTHFHSLVEASNVLAALASTPSEARSAAYESWLARVAELAQESNHVPLIQDPEHRIMIGDGWWENGRAIRNLARIINGEISTALTRGDYQQACDLAETNLLLAVMQQRGGTLIEHLIGSAMHGSTAKLLVAVRHDLPPDQARQLIALADRALAEREDIRSILLRDNAFAEQTYGWAARLQNVVSAVTLPPEIRAMLQTNLRQETSLRLLQTDLAIRLFHNEHGILPSSLDELVPTFLPSRPLDPSSPDGQLLHYRATRNDFLLYSVGDDGIDDGGRVTNRRTYYKDNGSGHYGYGYDFDLETLLHP